MKSNKIDWDSASPDHDFDIYHDKPHTIWCWDSYLWPFLIFGAMVGILGLMFI